MSSLDQEHRSRGTESERFHTTRWSIVRTAGLALIAGARDALATLCQTYWYPLYAYIRRKGYGCEDAQDLTQGFFAWLLEKNLAGKADRERGKFRSFLLASFDHFLAKEWRARVPKNVGAGVSFSRSIWRQASAASVWNRRMS